MTLPKVVIIATGVANTASVVAAFERLGARATTTTDPDAVRSAARVVLPGVGAFAAGMAGLQENDLDAALRTRVREGGPTLAICLGMQLFNVTSEEAPGVDGLGHWQIPVSRFPSAVRVPQLGWNRVEPSAGCRWLEAGDFYFANSYRMPVAPMETRVAWTEHGGRFVAAVEDGALLACQFHPELSGQAGAELLGRWLEQEALS